jgi:hypothetical protein
VAVGMGVICCRLPSPSAGVSVPAVTPFPVPAHRTGRAVFPHPAPEPGITRSPAVAAAAFLGLKEPEGLVQVLDGIACRSPTLDLVLAAQPPAEPFPDVAVHAPVGRADDPETEVAGPPRQRASRTRHPILEVSRHPPAAGRLAVLAAKPLGPPLRRTQAYLGAARPRRTATAEVVTQEVHRGDLECKPEVVSSAAGQTYKPLSGGQKTCPPDQLRDDGNLWRRPPCLSGPPESAGLSSTSRLTRPEQAQASGHICRRGDRGALLMRLPETA